MDHSHTTHPEIPDQDPAHDIDGKKTFIALLLSTIGIFVTMGILYSAFNAVTFHQRVKQVENAPTTERDDLHQVEVKNLAAGEGRISIDDAIADYLKKKAK